MAVKQQRNPRSPSDLNPAVSLQLDTPPHFPVSSDGLEARLRSPYIVVYVVYESQDIRQRFLNLLYQW